MKPESVIMDGNEAVACIAHKTNEVCAIYPITPSSPMGELADQWSGEGRTNIWGTIPEVIEMQSEGGAAGAIHGALQAGALSTTFTASQGLLLMMPNMFKIAGELTPTVFHVAARSVACQALSIFGDHSDVMAVRSTGFGFLASNSVQQAHDLALIAQSASLESRIPFIHFFDGFRTSHELNKIELISDETIRSMINDEHVLRHRRRALNPEHPVIRGTAQNPDVFFQARETVNAYYLKAPEIVQRAMDRFGALTGRSYRLFDYEGDPQAERVIVIMGSGAETVKETVDDLVRNGEKIGVLSVHLYRPFSWEKLLEALPDSAQKVAVLDRTKEPGAPGEPLFLDVVAALARKARPVQAVIGGRYGLSSKEFTPAMVKAVFDVLKSEDPPSPFTVGIHDDVTSLSLTTDEDYITESEENTRAMFFGLGSDGTVGAIKNTIKIIGNETAFHAQGYFEYDSKKSGSETVSHVRFGPHPIRSTYRIQSANFIGCHQLQFLEKIDVLKDAAEESVFLLNSPYGPEEVWERLPCRVQERMLARRIRFFVIDAYRVAREAGLGQRINTVMQTCFFALSDILPRETALEKIEQAIRRTYKRKGDEVVRKNCEAVERTVENLFEVDLKGKTPGDRVPVPVVPSKAPEFVRKVTAKMMEGSGSDLPVSALPVDGTYPTGTAQWEKRSISMFVPDWEPDLCIQCGKCSLICPHSCIRSKFYERKLVETAPASFKTAPLCGRGLPDQGYTLQVYLDDCTGCTLCVDICPVKNLERVGEKAINMRPKEPLLAGERENIAFFESLPETDRGRVDFSTVRGAQYLDPLFEFSGACAGCGETPYLKVLSQLFGDRLMIANATGCSSIYCGNLPTTPWTVNREGRGPAWSNSLFEDNAEFGLGFRLSADQHQRTARRLLTGLREAVGSDLVEEVLNAPQKTEGELLAQRERIRLVEERLAGLDGGEEVRHLSSLMDHLVRRSIWIVGGDGWAYDIGFGGLDHVLASGRDVNVLVLDTEVYSNTGGQASKATPLAATAKFASGGKSVGKKDLGMMAIAYGNVYVAHVAMGADPQQTLIALREAETYKGPSLILAYSHCIAHGINMEHGLRQQKGAVESGHWPLFRYNPELKSVGENPLELDSARPTIPLKEYAYQEIRYRLLTHTDPKRAEILMRRAQDEVNRKWDVYEKLAMQEQTAT